MTTEASEDFMPAEGFCVGEYIQDELEARGWTTHDCAERMGGDVDGTRVRRHFWPESEAR